jgi:hypothetical protein
MVTPAEVAAAHLARRQILTDHATSRALRQWARFDLDRLETSWELAAPLMVAQVVAAQREAARQTALYLAGVERASGAERLASQVAAESFGGVTLDGRELGPAMYGAVTTTKKLIGGGRPPREAFTVGASFLATVVGAAIQDMGRQADMVGAAQRTWTRYVRVLSAGACSRCAVLAGKATYRETFLRHPRCKCQSFPITVVNGKETNLDSLHMPSSPEEYFESLSRAQQDKVFTKAGAEAIRNGANPTSVVNARRGAYGIGYSGHYNVKVPTGSRSTLQPVTIGTKPDGSPLQVYATTEGTTRRGSFGSREIRMTGQATKDGRYRRSTTIRLMPEQIAIMAGDDPVRWRELLKRYGYLY